VIQSTVVLCTAESKKHIVVRKLRSADSYEEAREQLVNLSQGEMIYQFLVHTVDVKRGSLIDKLSAKNILSRDQRERIKKLKKTEARVDFLMMTLREKSAAEFDCFLATLSETGQQSVADVVRQTLHTLGQTGQNPMRSVHGKSLHFSANICV